jgi:two-component system response regulator
MKERYILLVEDNPDDEELTLLGLKDSDVMNEVKVVRDGEEALHFLFAEGEYKERNPVNLPALILLDFKLPKLSGFEVLERIRASSLTKCVPVVIPTSWCYSF